MKAAIILLATLLVAVLLIGCMAHEYTMGAGPSKGFKQEARQWYVLWGLIPISNVDINKMIGDAKDYQVRTAMEPLDVVISIVGNYVTVQCRTVTVTK